MIELGRFNQLKVVRTSDLGYMLSDGQTEVLMHFKESLKELKNNESVRVYIYADKENRLTATMHEPMLTFDKPAFVKVVNVIDNVGVFVSNNTPKDLLVSKDYLPYNLSQWPQVDDLLFCGLKQKKNYLLAKPLSRFDIISLKANINYALGERVEAYVNRVAEKGLGLITRDLVYVFVPNTQLRGTYRLGEKVFVNITKMLNGEAYGTLNEHKEILMQDDQAVILKYLKEHGGKMPLTAKSSSEDVLKYFNMSRKAFKRAYGALYKEQIIEFDENNTYLIKAID